MCSLISSATDRVQFKGSIHWQHLFASVSICRRNFPPSCENAHGVAVPPALFCTLRGSVPAEGPIHKYPTHSDANIHGLRIRSFPPSKRFPTADDSAASCRWVGRPLQVEGPRALLSTSLRPSWRRDDCQMELDASAEAGTSYSGNLNERSPTTRDSYASICPTYLQGRIQSADASASQNSGDRGRIKGESLTGAALAIVPWWRHGHSASIWLLSSTQSAYWLTIDSKLDFDQLSSESSQPTIAKDS